MAVTFSPLSGSPASVKVESSNQTSPGTVVVPAPAAAPAVKKSKPRKRVNTAEKRHQHNAIERQRRETLNGKFISLARLLPSLASSRRPSKSATVNGSIAHLNYQRNQRLLAAKLLRQLSAQNDQLLSEVNEWRKASGFPPKDALQTWTEEMEEVCSVEKEVFGTFAGCDGDDNDNDNDDDEDVENNESVANDMPFDALNGFGALITPRASVEGAELLSQPVNMVFNQAQHDSRNAAATMNGFNWSQDFGGFGSISSSTSSLPFNAFMSDSVERSSSGSPAGSIQGTVLTPPTASDFGAGFTHTPSPRSTQSMVDDKSAQPVAGGWSEQQLMFLRSVQSQTQQSHPALGRQQSMPSMPTAASLFGPQPQRQQQQHASPTDMYSSLFNHVSQAQHSLQQHQHQIAQLGNSTPGRAGSADAFTQNLLASMFPSQQGVSAEQVDQWRRLALSGLNAQPAEPAMQINTVRPSGLRMNSMWESTAVEGF